MAWAIALSTLSALGYAVAAVVQERLAEARYRGWGTWIRALGLTGLAAGLHVAALKFGTVSVVQPLGTLTLLFAMPVAAIRKHTRIGAGAWLDAGLTVAGLVTFMSMTVIPDRPAVFGDSLGTYLATGTALVVVGLSFAAWRAGPGVTRGVALAGASGIAFAMASVYTKAVITRFTLGAAAFVAVLAVTGYLLSQLSFRGAGLAAPVAMNSVTNPVVATIVGVLVFGEGFRSGGLGTAIAVVAGFVAGIGVVGLARRQAEDAESGRAGQPEEPAMR